MIRLELCENSVRANAVLGGRCAVCTGACLGGRAWERADVGVLCLCYVAWCLNDIIPSRFMNEWYLFRDSRCAVVWGEPAAVEDVQGHASVHASANVDG
jgi:hypothetical protein